MTRIIITNNIREIRVIRSSLKLHIIKFNVQTSKFKGKSSENKKRNTLSSIPFVIPTGFKPVTS